jgi:hypothetical protein
LGCLCINLSKIKKPHILLADHIEKNIMLIYQVNNLDKIFSELTSRGWIEEKRLEIPNGPCYTFRDPSDNHIGVYENKRPNVMEELKGRIDDYSDRHDPTKRN